MKCLFSLGKIINTAAVVLILAGSIPGQAEDSINLKGKIPATIAVQKRPYSLKNELSLNLSYLPLDYFTTYLTGGGSYSRYFSDYFGWEVVNAQYAQASSTGLEGFLTSRGAIPEEFDTMIWYVTSNLVYTPMYMKNLFMNRSVMWGDISFLGGYGISRFKKLGNVSTLTAGTSFRYFSNPQTAVKFDIRGLFYLAGGVMPNLSLTLSWSYNFSELPDSPPTEVEE